MDLLLDLVRPLIRLIGSKLATDSMSHSTVHDTVPGKVDIGQSLLSPVIPVGVDLGLSIPENFIDLGIISFSFGGNLLLRESELQKSSFHRVEIVEHIWQVFEAAPFFGLVDLGVVGYTKKDAQLFVRFDVTDVFFLMLVLLKCLYHM